MLSFLLEVALWWSLTGKSKPRPVTTIVIAVVCLGLAIAAIISGTSF